MTSIATDMPLEYGHHADMAKITDEFVKAAPVPGAGNRITYDDEIPGFGIRVTKNGTKSFVLNYYIHGRERRFTIGKYPAWSVNAARKEAKELRRDIDLGHDPLGQRIEDRQAPTVDALWLEYREKHLPKKRARSASDDESMWRTYILPRFGKEKVANLSPSDIDKFHADISKTKPVRANRVIEVLRKALNIAVRWKWISENPAVGVERNPEQARNRYLNDVELKRLGAALDSHPNQTACDTIRLLLLTGARKMEVLSARWDMFDFTTGIWTKPSSHTKQKKDHRAPLSQAALALLAALRDRDGADPVFVFPGDGIHGHLVDNKRTWLAVRRDADLDAVHLHDLRHTYASVLVSAGLSLPIVGALLGHTQAQTTQRYAHLYDDPLRTATETAAQKLREMTNA